MAWWEWWDGDWRAGRGCQAGRCWGQGEAARADEAGGEGRARLLGWRRLVQGEGAKLKKAVDGEVQMVSVR